MRSRDDRAREAVDCQRTQRHEAQLDFTLKLFERIGSLRALKAAILLRNGEYRAYLDDRADPSRYDDPKHFAEDYLVAEVLRKSPDLPLEGDLEEAARQKFLLAEQTNRKTNDRLWNEPLPSWWGEFSEQLLVILGPLTADKLESIPARGKHGPGASVGVLGDGIVKSDKYDAVPTVTEAAAPFLTLLQGPFVDSYWQGKRKVVRGSRLFFVPKDATSKRSCAKEPTWNVFGQLGIGSLIADRLRRFGVDIQDQTRNQRAASMAHLVGDATIDLSQASDLLARLMVYFALCYNQDSQGLRWWHLLNTFRSPEMNVAPRGSETPEWHRLEMMSSMGNGYTFPLETALFLALARATVPKDLHDRIRVYGDDIIVPQQHAQMVIERLQFIGCKPNTSKTFLAGRFFESCGTDWFDGVNVRPFYIRTEDDSPVPWQVTTANNLRAWLCRVYGYCPRRYLPLWEDLVRQIPHPWKHPVPMMLGDVGYHVAFSEQQWKRPSQDHTYVRQDMPQVTWDGVVVKHVMVAPETLDKRSFGVIASALSAMRPLDPPARRRGEKLHAYLRRYASWVTDSDDSAPMRGLEPRRGYLAAVRTMKNVYPVWDDALAWI